MDVVILCGGKGTRLSEETILRPKPMVDIGSMPILWHIMKSYSSYGSNRFILALGYKANFIKQYFYNYKNSVADFTLSMESDNEIVYHNAPSEQSWEIVLVDTGEETLKGGRIKRLEPHIQSDNFHLTYGDGVCDVNIEELRAFHSAHGRIGTVTAVRPPSRFGELAIGEDDTVLDLEEKPQMGKGLINGGYFVFKREILNYVNASENCDFEFGPLQELAKDNQLKAYKHEGFWQCMDNVRERDYLTKLVETNRAPWVRW